MEFYLDLLVIFCIIMSIINPPSIYVYIINILATVSNIFLHFFRVDQVIDHILNNNLKKQIMALLKLILANFFIAHIIGTVLIAITIN